MRIRRGSLWLIVFLALVLSGAAFAACGTTFDGSTFLHPDSGSDGSFRGDGGPGLDGTTDAPMTFGNDAPIGMLAISPTNQVVNVSSGQALPTVQYTATIGSQMVSASFTIDRGEIGSIVAASGVFTPGGTVGGVANVTAQYMGQSVTTPVTVFIHVVANGASGGDAGAGDAGDAGNAGGNGGVGGSGLGGPESDAGVGVLSGTPMPDPGLTWLYPYNQTVFPRGILAPLLQWQPGAQSYDGIYIHITEAAYEFQGFYSASATPFINSALPEDVWTNLTESNAGEPVTITLVFSAGGMAYGPISETWTIAQGSLKGTVYYNSYGTKLATNYCCDINNQRFGGATLAVQGGSTSPILVAGNNTECRVCHAVSADGSRLVTEQGSNYSVSSNYDLLNAYAETTLSPNNGTAAWPGLYPDGGALFLSNSAPLSGASNGASGLYSIADGGAVTAVPSTGLPSGFRAGCPVFSPDGTHVAMNYYAGAAFDGGTAGDGVSLASADFALGTAQFQNFATLFTPDAGVGPVVWPSFLPTNNGIVFELQLQGNGRDWGATRSTCDGTGTCSNSGVEAELWWIDVATKMAARLDNLNGKGYTPTNAATDHTDDSISNYEPTVNPVPSGGYAWVVFTSRRLYGNVATINPYWSDPRFHDLSTDPTTEEALGRGHRPQRAAGHRPEPPGVLPARPGAPRRQLARLLGASILARRTARAA